MNYKIGDKVKYISNTFGDADANPKWGGRYGKIAGTILSVDERNFNGYIQYHVKWDNGNTNSSYTGKDLKLIEKVKKIMNYENNKIIVKIENVDEAKDVLNKITKEYKETSIATGVSGYLERATGVSGYLERGVVTGIEIQYINNKIVNVGYTDLAYFNSHRDYDEHLRLTASEYLGEKTTVLPTKKRKAYVEISKEFGKIYISLKIPQEVEDFFKGISESTKVSETWFQKDKGVEYYAQSKELEKKLTEIDDYVYSDFGSGLMRDELINVAIVRTVNCSKGVKIHAEGFSSLTNADLQDYVRRLGLYIKRLWETNISTTRIKSVITFEI